MEQTRDLELFIAAGDDVNNIVARSADPQSRDAGHVPFEWLIFRAPADGNYELAVRRFGGSVPDWIQLVVWTTNAIEHYA